MTIERHQTEVIQATKPYFSTLAFEKFLNDHQCLRPQTEVLDLGTGLGSNLFYFGPRYPQTHFHGVDYIQEKVGWGQDHLAKLGLNNVSIDFGDWFNLPKEFRGKYDGIISVHTLCVFKQLKPALDAVVALNPRWIAFNALFFNGPLDVLVHIRDHTNPEVGDDNPDSDFNIFSLTLAKDIFDKAGYDMVAQPFYPPEKLPPKPGGARGTYTVETEWSPYTQFSGPVHLPWHFVLATRRESL